jgi:hypothetical protein
MPAELELVPLFPSSVATLRDRNAQNEFGERREDHEEAEIDFIRWVNARQSLEDFLIGFSRNGIP